MDERTRLSSLMVQEFGAPAATAPTSREAITDVANKVYGKFVGRTMHGFGPKGNKSLLVKDTANSLYDFVTDLKTDPLVIQDAGIAQANFDTRHDTWCLNRISAFRSSSGFALTYGHAQMWINMTLKGLDTLGHPAVVGVHRYLHVAAAYTERSHLAAFIGVSRPSGPSGKVPWSQLERDQYRDYQQRLRTAIAADSGGLLAPLDWEAQAQKTYPW
ncbi:hypothetical protein [Corynebacterium guangdongense]|uniref:Uncharacterized protein n=1 Tax=Corynebacterium guangdongense TaxID=1783348 RepID=A0ABU1ZUX9_9CORY|nr:hypothetical protein [Corynebacterium guangdongense]MDR7328736.1 hypothetical protein [Corynebacterium guangdongense]WJZ17313.1 hypothetical protein CGUA_03590 [Corynebacterium guangdongense]